MKNKAFKTIIISSICVMMTATGCSAIKTTPELESAIQTAQQTAAQITQNVEQNAPQTVALYQDTVEELKTEAQALEKSGFYDTLLTAEGNLKDMLYKYGENWKNETGTMTVRFTQDGSSAPYLTLTALKPEEMNLSNQEKGILQKGSDTQIQGMLEDKAEDVAVAANSKLDKVQAVEIGNCPGVVYEYNQPNDDLKIAGAMAVYGGNYYDIKLGIPTGFAGASQQPYAQLLDNFLKSINFE